VGQQKRLQSKSPDLFVAALGEEGQKLAFLWSNRWSEQGLWTEMDFGAKSLKSQMKRADKLDANFVMIIGDNEIKDGAAVLRNMKTKKQVRIELEKIVESVRETIQQH
jgi:histidyl-tRNA synthetase